MKNEVSLGSLRTEKLLSESLNTTVTFGKTPSAKCTITFRCLGSESSNKKEEINTSIAKKNLFQLNAFQLIL